MSVFTTHEVTNQAPPLAPYDAWTSDTPLREAIVREGGGWAQAELAEAGRVYGGEAVELAFTANENKPKLRLFDRFGHRLDEVAFHPSYHQLMALGMAHGVNGFAWRRPDQRGAHVARMAISYMHSQADQGTGCPLTMTYAAVPTLRQHPALAKEWMPRITSLEYDPRLVPAADKRGCTIGMGMTEKQGGSDVRANTTQARSGPGDLYTLVGHKWFFSAPMSDAFFVLAQADKGLSCFLLPRVLPDGSRNAIRIQRLKDKLGDWSNASSEVEFAGALAWLIGDEGRGVANILQMVALTRQDCMIGSSAIMRQALVQAIHHCRHRSAFGKPLIAHALMQNVLADLALESEAHTALTARVARAIDASAHDENEAAFARIATAIGKYWVCKRAAPFINEAQECLGGAGYVEESILPRLYRQAPLNSIWEGSGNIQCLDVLRAAAREPATVAALFTELRLAKGLDARLDAETDALAAAFACPDEGASRLLVERTAIALQSGLLLRAGQPHFCTSRLGAHGAAFGTLAAGTPLRAIIDRSFSQM